MTNTNSVKVNYLNLIEQGVDAWNEWRLCHPDIKPDLSQIYLFEMKLCGANLRETILNRTCLIGADLSGADLSGADLTGAYVSRANLTDADLQGANLDWANFSGANLTNANLSQVTAEHSNFSEACLTGICLEGWRINAATQFHQANCAYVYLRQQPRERYCLDSLNGYLTSEELKTCLQEATVAIATPSATSHLANTTTARVPLTFPPVDSPGFAAMSSAANPGSTEHNRVANPTRLWSGVALCAMLAIALLYPLFPKPAPIPPAPIDQESTPSALTAPLPPGLCEIGSLNQDRQLRQLSALKAQEGSNFSRKCQLVLDELLYRTGLAKAKGDGIRGNFAEGVKRLCQVSESSSDYFILARSQLNAWYENDDHPEYGRFIANYLKALADEGKACPAAKDMSDG